MNNFKNQTVYQIYVKSFMDSNRDGIGDLNGITQKLDYLQQLGADYLWLTPFYESPMNDNGYDVKDYISVNPMFGTMKDFDHLVKEANKRNIGLMLDMVFNHTSTEHIWFQKALAGDAKYRNYYIFRDGVREHPPTNWKSKFGNSAWKYEETVGKWYLHLFDITQADLNWENPEVREELKEVIRFWKKKGVKGFRFDVVNLISKPCCYEDDEMGDGRRFYTDGPGIHEYLKELTADTGIEDMVTVGEMSSTSLENCIRYTDPEEKELSMCFNFHHLKVDYKNGNKWELAEADFMQLKNLLITWQEKMEECNGWNAVFWCNHDQPRVVSRFGDDKRYWKESAKMLATAIHMLRGTPYIYQGEEIGMTNADYPDIACYKDVESRNYYKIMLEEGKSADEARRVLAARSRDNARTPMQWSEEKSAGFTQAVPWISVPENYKNINVRQQTEDTDSILHFYKQLITLRKQYTAIADGNIQFMYKNHPDLFAYVREDSDSRILVLNNFHDQEITLEEEISLSEYEILLGNYFGSRMEHDHTTITALRPYESLILKLSDAKTDQASLILARCSRKSKTL